MFYGQLSGFLTPFVASFALMFYKDIAFIFLLILDILFAFSMIFVVSQMREISVIEKVNGLQKSICKQWEIMVLALKNVLHKKDLQTIVLYRSG